VAVINAVLETEDVENAVRRLVTQMETTSGGRE